MIRLAPALVTLVLGQFGSKRNSSGTLVSTAASMPVPLAAGAQRAPRHQGTVTVKENNRKLNGHLTVSATTRCNSAVSSAVAFVGLGPPHLVLIPCRSDQELPCRWSATPLTSIETGRDWSASVTTAGC